jgi:2-amino-4-hydroxy-6-hydroxymethyldihydropteridine diphosphokinase
MKIVFLGVGTNLGNRENNLCKAIDGIKEYVGKVLVTSSVYETEPWGFQSEDKFLNLVVKVETGLTPSGLLGKILMIESLLGRERSGKQYSSRILDIDILLYEEIVMDEISLRIPHPQMHNRRFVLIPLCEIEKDLVHPVLKVSVTSLLDSCGDKSKVKIYEK